MIESAGSLSEELVAALAAAAVVDHVVVVVDEGGVGIVRIVVVIAIEVLERVKIALESTKYCSSLKTGIYIHPLCLHRRRLRCACCG